MQYDEELLLLLPKSTYKCNLPCASNKDFKYYKKICLKIANLPCMYCQSFNNPSCSLSYHKRIACNPSFICMPLLVIVLQCCMLLVYIEICTQYLLSWLSVVPWIFILFCSPLQHLHQLLLLLPLFLLLLHLLFFLYL